MPTLLDTAALFVTTRRHPLDGAANCTLLDGDGSVVATVRDRAGIGRRTARTFGILNRGSKYEWDVLDPAGNRILGIVKPSAGFRGPSPEVSLADGTPLGRAKPTRWLGLPPVTLLGPDEKPLAELVPVLGEHRSYPFLQHRICSWDGSEVGEIALETRDDWGYHLTFRTGARIPVRALTIAYTVCLVQQRTG